MDLVSILLGAIQGLTEFLPISSSGHLNLVSYLFGKDLSLVFEVILHLASLFAVLIYTFPLIKSMLQTIVKFCTPKSYKNPSVNIESEDKVMLQLVFALIISTLATAPIGILWKDALEGIHIRYVGMGFLFTSIVLLIPFMLASHRKKIQEALGSNHIRELPHVGLVQAVILGLAQGLAIFPGISRSGTTISIGVLLGMNYLQATRYSFLMAIPAIIASFVFSIPDLMHLTKNVSVVSLVLSILICFVIALFSLRWLTVISKKGKIWLFSIYLLPLSLIVIFIL